MPFSTRTDVLERIQKTDGPIISAGIGSGFAAKFAERGGADFCIIHSAGRFRNAGTTSLAAFLPFGDANAITKEIAEEVVSVVEALPVFAGVCATDPRRSLPAYLKKLQAIGVDGIQNFPTVGVIDGAFRQHLEEGGLSFETEIEMIARASEEGFATAPYVFTESEAQAMVEAGADIVIPHMGLTAKGDTGAATTLSLDEAAERVQAMRDAAAEVDPSIPVLCHGGPIAEPEDAQAIFDRTSGVDGFFGASSIERLPTEPAIEEQTRQFTELEVSADKAEGSDSAS